MPVSVRSYLVLSPIVNQEPFFYCLVKLYQAQWGIQGSRGGKFGPLGSFGSTGRYMHSSKTARGGWCQGNPKSIEIPSQLKDFHGVGLIKDSFMEEVNLEHRLRSIAGDEKASLGRGSEGGLEGKEGLF